MIKYLIKGKITDASNNVINNLNIQAMDMTKNGSKIIMMIFMLSKTGTDGSFEITFDVLPSPITRQNGNLKYT